MGGNCSEGGWSDTGPACGWDKEGILLDADDYRNNKEGETKKNQSA